MGSPATRAEIAYRRLRADIMGGQRAPGSALPFAELSDAYGASMGVLREALSRLAAEGLAVSRAQHGFRVVDVSLEDLNDLTDSRILIETAVLRDSIEHGDLEWETRLVSAHHRLKQTSKHVDDDRHSVTDEWSRAHQSFHVALLGSACNTRLLTMADGLRAAAELYRRWSIPFESVERDVPDEHRNLMELCLARRSDDACAALAAHLSFTRDLIVQGMEDDR